MKIYSFLRLTFAAASQSDEHPQSGEMAIDMRIPIETVAKNDMHLGGNLIRVRSQKQERTVKRACGMR